MNKKNRDTIEVVELDLQPISDEELMGVLGMQETTNTGCEPVDDGGGGGGGGGGWCTWYCPWYPPEN